MTTIKDLLISRRSLMVAGIMAFAVLVGMGARSRFHAQRYRQPAFTLISQVTDINSSNPSQQLHGQQTRYAFSDGSYHVMFNGESGTKREYFFKSGSGFFEVDGRHQQLVRNSRMSPDAGGHRPLTAQELLSDPQYIRTETLLGLTVYVMRVKDEQSGQQLADLYFAVETGSTPLKTIDYGKNGMIIGIENPISIVFGEPNWSLRDGPAYPIVEMKTQQSK